MKAPIWKFAAALCVGLVCLGGWPLAAGERSCDEAAENCVAEMTERLRHKGWVGIELNHEDHGGNPRIVKVIDDSPAAAAGLRVGDRLLRVNGTPYRTDNEEAVREVYRASRPGTTITYVVSRDGSESEVVVTLGSIPNYLAAQWIGQHMMHHHAATADVDDRD